MLHARFEDTFAACSTMVVLVLLKTDLLSPWHMYLLNAVNGLMNTVQRPASDVAMTLIVPQKHYQRFCGLWSFSQSLVTILPPVFATVLFALAGIGESGVTTLMPAPKNRVRDACVSGIRTNIEEIPLSGRIAESKRKSC